METISASEFCKALGRDPVYVHNLQKLLELHIPPRGQGYSQNYLIFMEKVVALRALHIPQDDIREIFETEKKVLRLLHMDALTDSPTWYLDSCTGTEDDFHADRLLLSGAPLGFPMDATAVQHTLDFGQRDAELFKGSEMGEDLKRVLKKYRQLLKDLGDRVAKEKSVLENALYWARGFLKYGEGAR